MKELETQGRLSLKLQAYNYLKDKILRCEYAPNDMLNEQKLCEEMGNISRTPMRDALGRLEQEGLVAILPKKGLMVSGITAADVRSIFEVRLLVEPYALRCYGRDLSRKELLSFRDLMLHPERIEDFYQMGDAFCEADDAFHALLVSGLPNKYLRTAHEGITWQNTRFRIMTGKVGMLRKPETCAEHLQVLDAALEGDWNAAADAMEKHLTLAQELAIEVVRQMGLGD